ncbi:MAG: DUF1207 domain-containing protein [Melioribacteraceae bacterium]
MKSLKILFFLLLLIQSISFAQTNLEIFPSNLLIKPFTANTLKPKLGSEFQLGKNELVLNIGGSSEIIHFNRKDNSTFSIGAEMFTFTRLRGETNFHFPVDAIDYLFGFTFGYKKKCLINEFGARLRVSHISAHFVDGHFDPGKNEWKDGRNPKVYSREFFELMPFYKINNLRMYLGLTYIFSIDPTDIGQDQYQIGFDYFATNLLSENLTPYIAYDFRLVNIYSYSGNNNIEAGIKYGYADGKGMSLYLKYFSGYNIHGEYFDVKEKYLTVGINFDL